jgi:hypothetical protein
MLYPVVTTPGSEVWIQTSSISSMTQSTLTILMVDTTTHTVSAAQFADIIGIVNKDESAG